MPLVIWHPFVDSGSPGRRAGRHPIYVTPSGIMRASFWPPGTHCKSLIHSRFIPLIHAHVDMSNPVLPFTTSLPGMQWSMDDFSTPAQHLNSPPLQ